MHNRKLQITLFTLSTFLWLVSIIGSFIYHRFISLGCTTSSDSVFGHSEWSWLPPGQVCHWDLASGLTATTGPSYISLLIPLILALWGFSIFASRK